MNRNDKEMGDRRPETRVQRATPAAPPFPVSDLRSPVSLLQPFQRASSLVTTLLVLVVLSTIVVVFMQSMTVERNVARSAKNILQAKLLADAAGDEAVQRMLITTTNGPLGAVWDRDAAGNPYLFLGKRIIRGANVVTTRVPLFSSAAGNFAYFENLAVAQISTNSQNVADLDNNGNSVTRSLSAEIEIVTKINSQLTGQSNGMVGLTDGTSPLALPVNWTYVRDTSGRIIGRYAFWVDDECSKLDLRFAGQPANAAGNHTRSNGTNLSEISLLVLTNAPVGATTNDVANLLKFKTLTNGPATPAVVQYSIAGSPAGVDINTWHKMRPYVTSYSLLDDRSPDGKRRLNLNAVVKSTNTAQRIEAETFAIRDAITNSLPSFGLRYYSATGGALALPTSQDQSVYVTKIAANIRDSVDTNNVATIIQSDGTAYVTNSPDFISYSSPVDSDLPIAFGKESGPFLSEYFRIVRVIDPLSPTSTASSTPVNVTLRFAHYIELHNPTARILTYADLGPDPFVMLSHRTSWFNSLLVGSTSALRLADIKIYLPSTFTIPAGGFAVLTTDGPPWRDSQTDFIGSASNRYEITGGTGAGHWELVNAGGKDAPSGSDYEEYTVNVAAITGDYYDLKSAVSASATYTDQRERLTFGNQEGIIDYTLRIYSDPGGNSVGRNGKNPAWASTFLSDSFTFNNNTPSGSNTEQRFTRGDVRSNTEASRIGMDTSACWKDGGGAYGDTLTSGPQQTLGLPNYKSSTQADQTGVQRWRQWWYEYTADPAGNHFVANKPIGSLGELGAIYDPVRYDINGFRSQGATLRIGQSDSPTNNRANSTVIDYQNWLGGRGADDVTSTNYMKNAFLLMDVFRTDDVNSGRVNPNTLVRDPVGIVFRSVLDKFDFESAATNQASSVLSGLSLNASTSLSSLRSFATNPSNGYYISVGDLSRAPLFFAATNALAGVSMTNVSDAGREEFMRRSANLLSTQSLAFTVFIKAQAGSFERTSVGGDRFRVRATMAREMVVQIQPTYAPGGSPLVPSTPVGWNVLRPRTINY